MATESSLRKSVADWMVPYIGIKEGSSEHLAILKIFNDSKLCTRYTMTSKDAWCATTVSAAFISLGLTNIFPCVECSCAKMITLASAANIWQENDAYVPDIGDVVMYDWQDSGSGDNTGNPDHVGIVTSVDTSKKTFKVIEGNKSDTVGYRTMNINGKYIRGFIIPNYASIATNNDSSDSTSLTAGKKVSLTNANLYNTAATKNVTKTISGTYYIWSASTSNNRIRITTTSDYVGKIGKVTGWVETSACGAASSTSSSTSTSTSTKTTTTSSTTTSTTSASSSSKLTVDGDIGTNTVKKLQKVMSTTQDGKISGQSSSAKKYWTSLSACSWTGGASDVVKATQKFLNNNGYSCGSADGLLGTKTAKALQKYLIAKGYSCGSSGADGYFGTNSAKALQKWLNTK